MAAMITKSIAFANWRRFGEITKRVKFTSCRLVAFAANSCARSMTKISVQKSSLMANGRKHFAN